MTWIDYLFIIGGLIALVLMTRPLYMHYKHERRATWLEWERARVMAENQVLADEAVARIRDLAREQRREPGR